MRGNQRCQVETRSKGLLATALISAIALLGTSFIVPAFAATTIITYIDAQGRTSSSTIPGFPARAALNTYYNLDAYLYLYTFDSNFGYRADLDYNRAGSNFKVTDNGSIIIIESKVVDIGREEKPVAGIDIGDIIRLTLDTSANTGKVENLSKGTLATTVLATDIVYRKTVSDSDTVAPSVSITAPSNGATVSGTISVSASASDNVGVSKVELYVDGVLKSTDSTSPYSFGLDTTLLSDALHSLKAVAVDSSNNKGSAEISVEVKNVIGKTDTTAPVVTPPVNQVAEATSASGAAVNYPAATAMDDVDGSLTAACTPISGSTFPLGSTVVTCTATDSSGNMGSASFTVTVRDTTAPSLSLPANKVVEATSASGATVTFTATATDLVDGSRSVVCTPASGSTFAIGTKTVSCSATDSSGNMASGSFTVTVRDTKAPTVSISSPASGGVLSGTVTTSATASDAVGVSKVELHIDGLLKSTDLTSPYSFSLDTKSLTDGTHAIKVVAYDTSNNQASAQVSVTIDNTMPSISITSPSNGATVSGTIAVTASAADSMSGVYGVYFYIDGTFIVTDFTSPYESTAIDTTLYADGTHTIKAMALDKAFNVASQETTVNVDNSVAIPPPDTTAPTVSFIDPVNGETISGTVTVQVSATDNVGVNVVYFYVDGVNKGSDFAAPYTFSLDTTTIADGSHILKAKAFDKSNNQNYAEISVEMWNAPSAPPDANPPVLSIPSSMTVEATGPTGAIVTYSASATDDVDGTVTVTCTPASGSTFAIESTVVDCYAIDSSDNFAADSFIVTVQDTTKPTVSISSPTNNQVVSGVIGITTLATDKVGVAYVDLYMDGTYLGSDIDFPYDGFEVDTTSYNDGTHKLQATAVDEYGNTASSAIVSIIVDNTVHSGNAPPTVTIVSPTSGSTVKGSTIVSISADDSDGSVDYIELYLDGTLLATLPGGESTTYTFTWDTTSAANGSHVLKAIAYDDLGNSSEDSETVKVQNKGAGGSGGGKGGGPKK